MWLILLLIVVGFAGGMYIKVPMSIIGTPYVPLVLLAVLDSLTYSIAQDIKSDRSTGRFVLARLVLSLTFGGFVIYFGEKTGIDLRLVALVPIGLGLAVNLSKFLPK
jgi:small basic protein